jgi:phosphoenolpyruvate---glycerone phosphotransferase subunit DhaK
MKQRSALSNAFQEGPVSPREANRMAAPPSTIQKLSAEFLGTAFLVYIGAGSVAATGVIAAGTKVPFSMTQLGMISFAFMLVIVGAVYAIGHISGGHINPAVTVSLAVTGKFPWRDVPGYIAAQVVGAIAGAAAIFLTLGRAATVAAGGGVTSYNTASMGFGRATLIEAIGTFMLVFVIFGVIDHRAVPGWAPMAIGAVVFAVIIVVGHDRGGDQPGPVFRHGAHAERVRRLGELGTTARVLDRGVRRRCARRARLRGHRAGPFRRGAHQPGAGRAGGQRTANPGSKRGDVMKKLINAVDDVVADALRGVAAAHPSLAVDVPNKVITRAGGPKAGKVGLVSGGGSGHEPLHGGFVGYGMLDAACPGEVFTSPVPDQMLAATQAVNAGAGVLHIVKNYTGDVLNFQMAAELATDDGIEVASVIVNDDVAVQDSLYTAGRRGVGGTVFVEKIAGALAEEGAGLSSVADVAREVNERSRSFGIALTSCTVPAAGKPTFELGDSEIELGIGIHGEPGRTRGPLRPASELAAVALDAIGADIPLDGELLVMVNGMGGTPLIELYVVYAAVAAYIGERGGRIARNLVGNYITSLEMQGFSVTVAGLTPELTRLWDAPVDTPALRWGR